MFEKFLSLLQNLGVIFFPLSSSLDKHFLWVQKINNYLDDQSSIFEVKNNKTKVDGLDIWAVWNVNTICASSLLILSSILKERKDQSPSNDSTMTWKFSHTKRKLRKLKGDAERERLNFYPWGQKIFVSGKWMRFEGK